MLALAGDRDPIDAVSEAARALVSRALDEDWHGPPFDPIELAAIVGIDVRPLADVPDARTVSFGADAFRIEFNPTRPAGRVRYSVAHEIAHTLFPDCGEQVRHRGIHGNAVRDEWQLEALCNIAAAEILMPYGSFPTADESLVDIDRVLGLQKQFKVSTEALLLRIVGLAPFACASFSATKVDTGAHAGRWRIDYIVGSPSWVGHALRGVLIPETTILESCVGVGYTDHGAELWGKLQLDVQAVGLPPYPGTIAPRAAGFIVPYGEQQEASATRAKEVVGNALEPRGEGPFLVAHVVTDKAQTWGGGGFAAAVRNRWPDVHRDFASWAGLFGKELQLATVRFCDAAPGVRVASMVAQHGYRQSRSPRIRYSALQRCLEEVFRAAAQTGASVHMPRIGTGHGGGTWPVIRDMITAAAARWRVQTTIYRLSSALPTAEQDSLFSQPAESRYTS